MARSKKSSFVLYYELEAQTSILSNEQLGRLIRAVFAYEIRGECTAFEDDLMLQMCFQFVKATLDVNKEKYKERCEINRENGKSGGRPKINELPKNDSYGEEPDVEF
jgi:hypothetical protein